MIKYRLEIDSEMGFSVASYEVEESQFPEYYKVKYGKGKYLNPKSNFKDSFSEVANEIMERLLVEEKTCQNDLLDISRKVVLFKKYLQENSPTGLTATA